MLDAQDELILGLWGDILEQKPAKFLREQFKMLYLWEKEQGIFPSAEKAISNRLWQSLGDSLHETLYSGNTDVANLIIS